MKDELTHYQILGAKHGVRRYQNEDGSLTPLGRIHYGVGAARNAARSKEYDNGEKTAFGKLDERRTSNNEEDRPGESKTFLDDLSTKSEMSKNASLMTDEELVRAIDRLNLEETYRRFSERKIEDSKSGVQKALEKFGNTFVDSLSNKLANTSAQKVVDYLFPRKKEEDNNKNSKDYSNINADKLSGKELSDANKRLQAEIEYKQKLKNLGYSNESETDKQKTNQEQPKKQKEQEVKQEEPKKESKISSMFNDIKTKMDEKSEIRKTEKAEKAAAEEKANNIVNKLADTTVDKIVKSSKNQQKIDQMINDLEQEARQKYNYYD